MFTRVKEGARVLLLVPLIAVGCVSSPGEGHGRAGAGVRGGDAVQEEATPQAGEDSRITGPLVPRRGVLLGAWVRPEVWWPTRAVKQDWLEFEEIIGRKLDIGQTYILPGQELWWKPAWDARHGRIPLITWSGLNSIEVVNGVHDQYIESFAVAVKALRVPVFIRYGAEMDGEWNAGWVVSPEAFVAAWRYIHRKFKGVPVVWVWCPQASAFPGARGGAERYYPGDAYVDWVCADGFNWYGCRPGAEWEGFAEKFAAFYAWGTARGKPLMVGETGAVEDPRDPFRKARWFDQARRAMKESMPNIKAFVYFDSQKDCMWRVTSSTASVDAFIDLAHDPHFQPQEVGPVVATKDD